MGEKREEKKTDRQEDQELERKGDKVDVKDKNSGR